jgi:acetoin utilization protein AcuB
VLVGDIMQAPVITVRPDSPMAEAGRLLAQRGIRHLPVVDGAGALVGILSDRDFKRAVADPRGLETLRVDALMTREVITTVGRVPVEEAARLMVMEKISALPVVEGGRLVGIVTETDILDLFVRALGASEPSSRLDVTLEDSRGAIAGAIRALEAAGTAVASVVTLPSPRGWREVVIRIPTIDPRPAVRALRAAGYRVRDADRPAG